VPDLEKLQSAKTEEEKLREELRTKSKRLMDEFRKIIRAYGGDVDSSGTVVKQPSDFGGFGSSVSFGTIPLSEGVMPVIITKSGKYTRSEAAQYSRQLSEAARILYFVENYSGVTTDELADLSARIKYYKK
jgi:hypothetical protein